MEFIVEHDYKSQEDDELTIKIGDIINNCNKYEDGWMQGELNGKVGLFPDNFGKVVEKKPGAKAKIIQSNPIKSRDDFNAPIGTIVEILDESDIKYYRVRSDSSNREGRIPKQCVEKLSNVRKSSGHLVDDNVGKNSIPQKPVGSIGYGNIFADNKIKLKPVGNKNEDSTPVSGNVTKNAGPPLVVRANKPVFERATVIYAYQANNVDELNLCVGDIVNVLDKNLPDRGWWKGELNGKEGLFPDNFVTLIKEDTNSNNELSNSPIVPSKLSSKKYNAGAIIAEHSFDSQTSATNSLVHLNKDRPKPPGKRKPTKFMEEANDTFKSTFFDSSEDVINGVDDAQSKKVDTIHGYTMNGNSKFPSGSHNIEELIKKVDQLQSELKLIKDTWMPRSEFEKFKISQITRVENLIKDFDSEKKLTVTRKVELDRLERRVRELEAVLGLRTELND